MFEPISLSLSQLAGFAVLGFFLGMSYEPLRIARLFKKQGVIFVAVQDFFFLILAGIMTFAYSMELGSGRFRWFFIAGELFGVVVYFLTVGKVISLFSGFIVKLLKTVSRCFIRYLIKPFLHLINKFFIFMYKNMVKLYNFVSKLIKNATKHLKKHRHAMYNSIVHIKQRHKSKYERLNGLPIKQSVKKPKGDIKNVIKAKVTKVS